MGLPPTMLLQIAVSALGTAIGLFGLAIARGATPADPVHRRAWRLSGATFALMGASGLVQCSFGSWAILAGDGSGVWSAYLRWAAAFNYSRNFAEVVFLALLLGGAWHRRGEPVPGGSPWTVLLLAMLAGGLFGWREGSLVAARHYPGIAVMDAALFACWALVMSVVVVRDGVDRWLLLAMAVWAVPLPLNALWFFWLARTGTGVWTPRPFDMQLYRLAFHALTLLVVVHRWRLARRGEVVYGLAGSMGR